MDKKFCCQCGAEFSKRYGDSFEQWAGRRFCSRTCANEANKGPKFTIIERIENHIERIPEAGCWIWVGSHDGKFYGQMATLNGNSPVKAHRASYEAYVGPIPSNSVLRHRCDNPSCVNPHHLEPGTQKQNAADMVERGRFNRVVLNNLRRTRLINAEQAEEIRRLHEGGMNYPQIAKIFGVNRTTVGTYVRRKRG